MKIKELADINLSNYKLAFFEGDSLGHSELCQDDVMALAEGGGIREDNYNTECLFLTIALIPKNASLTFCGGDYWDDYPASLNASGFYEYPKGTIFLEGKLGSELEIKRGESS